jgi:hypothetical protein
MRGDEWEQGVEPVDHTEEVDIHDLVEVVCVFPAASKTYSCIESKKGNFTYRFISLADPRTSDILLGENTSKILLNFGLQLLAV